MRTQSAKKKVSIRLFGVLSMIDDQGREIVPRGKRAKALIAMLVLSTNGVRHRKWLKEKLWSNRSEEQATLSLRQELSRLRRHFKTFDSNLIEADRESVRLALRYYDISTDIKTAHSGNMQVLEGLDLRDTAFRDWLKDIRDRLENENNIQGPLVGQFQSNRSHLIKAVSVNELPVIHIEPFESIGESERSEIFAAGLTEELLTLFGRLIGFFTLVTDPDHIAAESHLVLKGAVRYRDDAIRITTRLVSFPESRHIWSQRYTYVHSDSFEIQENIARILIELTQSSLSDGEWASIWINRVTTTAAWEYFQIGRYNENIFRPEYHLKAIENYKSSLECDPDFSPAKIAIGFCLVDMVRLGWAKDSKRALIDARSFASEVRLIEGNNNYADALQAFISIASGDYTDALDRITSSVSKFERLSPEILGYQGAILGYLGDLHGEYEKYQEALKLTSYPPLWISTNMALVCLLLELPEGKSICEFVLSVDPNNLRAHIFLTAIYVQIGDIDSAKDWANRLRELQPDFEAANWSHPNCFKDSALYFKVTDYLINAGLS